MAQRGRSSASIRHSLPPAAAETNLEEDWPGRSRRGDSRWLEDTARGDSRGFHSANSSCENKGFAGVNLNLSMTLKSDSRRKGLWMTRNWIA